MGALPAVRLSPHQCSRRSKTAMRRILAGGPARSHGLLPGHISRRQGSMDTNRARTSNIEWTLCECVPTLPHQLSVLVKVRKRLETGFLEPTVEDHSTTQRQLIRLTNAQVDCLVEGSRGRRSTSWGHSSGSTVLRSAGI